MENIKDGWYVIQVESGSEARVIDLVQHLVLACKPQLATELFVPRYQVKKRFGGQWRLCEEKLLPGYVFVVTAYPKELQAELLGVPAFARLLHTDQSFVKLDDSEIRFINAFTQPDRRIIDMSEGVIEGDQIQVLNGPLMGQVGLIKKIDRHKRLAYLEVDMMHRKVNVKVGLEIVRKY